MKNVFRSLIAGSILLCASTISFADDSAFHLVDKNSFSFTAPTVTGITSGLTDVSAVGTIVYDASSNQFKGLDNNGVWDPMTIPGGAPNVTSTGPDVYNVNSAYIANNGSCSITDQTGSWITSVSHTGSGQCTLTIPATEFTSVPFCTCTADSGTSAVVCTYNRGVSSSTSVVVTGFTGGAGGGASADGNFTITCMGVKP